MAMASNVRVDIAFVVLLLFSSTIYAHTCVSAATCTSHAFLARLSFSQRIHSPFKHFSPRKQKNTGAYHHRPVDSGRVHYLHTHPVPVLSPVVSVPPFSCCFSVLFHNMGLHATDFAASWANGKAACKSIHKTASMPDAIRKFVVM